MYALSRLSCFAVIALCALLLGACVGGGSPSHLASAQLDRPNYSVSVSGVGLNPAVEVTCIDVIGLMCEVEWTGNNLSDDAIIYRSTANDPLTATEVGRVWAAWPVFFDRNVVPGTRYYYWVVFEDRAGQRSPLSPFASACPTRFGERCAVPVAPPVVAKPDGDDTDVAGPDLEAVWGVAARAAAGDRVFYTAERSGFTHVGAAPGARVSRAALVAYLQDDAGQTHRNLLRFDEPPTVRVRRNVPDGARDDIEAVVGLLNLYLPADWQIVFDRDAPAVTRLIPEDGEILIEYSSSWSWGVGSWNRLGTALIYARGATIGKALVRIDERRAGDRSHFVLAHEILHALGRNHPSDQSLATIMQETVPQDLPTFLLHTLDAEALLAVYGRLEAGDTAQDIEDDLGPWEEDGTTLFGASGFVTYGVEYRNGSARPWAYGMTPRTALAGNDALEGDVTWTGGLAGFTPAGESVTGDAGLTVALQTLTGDLSFTDMQHEDETAWKTGRLDYQVQVGGNAFERTGGDEGSIQGRFFGPAHESMGGILVRDDIRAGFGGSRE